MPHPSLEIPCKTAAGHAALAAAASSLTVRQLEVLRLVDGRRTDDELDRLTVQAGSVWAALHTLERRGLIVRAACVCLPGETPLRRATGLLPARRLLARVLLLHTPLSGLGVLLRVYRAPDLDALRRLLPAVRARLAASAWGDNDGVVEQAEGLLDAG